MQFPFFLSPNANSLSINDIRSQNAQEMYKHENL